MRLNKGIPTLPTLKKYQIPFGLGFVIPFHLGWGDSGILKGASGIRHPGSRVQQGPTGFSNRHLASGIRDHCSYNSKFYCFTFLFF
jgi:alpha-D-ribose 1-methylphosphonate 5-phosphate C-P lyase